MGIKKTVSCFLIWRLGLFAVVFLATAVLPLQFDFLGGEIGNYLLKPYLWAWANFDGEYYMQIARDGYLAHTFFYFPLYPLLIDFFAGFTNRSIESFLYTGLLISNISFLFVIFGLYKLARIDFSEKTARITLVLVLLFPTSFFFASYYSESLFLALSVWSVYFFRKRKYFSSSVFSTLASSTRVFGIFLLVYFLAEVVKYFLHTRKFNYKYLFNIFLTPLGFLAFLFYQYYKTGNFLTFTQNLEIFGEQRMGFTIFPQVFYRYLVKIIPNLNFDYFPYVFTVFLEFLTALIFLYLVLGMFTKKMYSYGFYSLSVYVVSTLSGSFSSFPRYALAIFPAFFVAGEILANRSRQAKIFVFTVLFLCLIVSTTLFARGYWVS